MHEQVLLASGGEDGVLSFASLDAAVHRPYVEVFGRRLFPTTVSKAAALFHSIATTHPFVDGNKRTAGTVTSNFLEAHGLRLNLTDEQVVAFALDVVCDRIDEHGIAAFLKANSIRMGKP